MGWKELNMTNYLVPTLGLLERIYSGDYWAAPYEHQELTWAQPPARLEDGIRAPGRRPVSYLSITSS
jgi:hypothetical protein